MNAKLEKIHEDMKKAEEKEIFFRQKKEELAKRYEQEQMAEVKSTLRVGEMTPEQFDKMMNFLLKNKHAYGKGQKQSKMQDITLNETEVLVENINDGKYDSGSDEVVLTKEIGGDDAE